MRMHLAGLGWLNDDPSGNRLRWAYPLHGLGGDDRYLGLPETLVVERAWVDEDIPKTSDLSHLGGEPLLHYNIPIHWWQPLGDVQPTGFLPKVYQLQQAVQSIRFTYRGTPGAVQAYDSATNVLLAQRRVNDGDVIQLDGTAIDLLFVFGWAPLLENVRVLDLFAPRGLQWEAIAEIRVRDTIGLDLAQSSLRNDGFTNLTSSEWTEFVEGATRGQASVPSVETPGEPTDWDAFSFLMGLRWEHALLFGHGFFDGPRTKMPEVDRLDENLILSEVAQRPVAYRVLEKERRVAPSNIVVCPPWIVSPLSSPSQPQYERPEIRMMPDLETAGATFSATFGLRWDQVDPNALGVEIEEETSESPTISSPPGSENYESRTRFPDDPPFRGSVARSRDVAFHDVRIRCRARATDGWDRQSAHSPWTPWTPFVFDHAAAPPNFTGARIEENGSVQLNRQVGDPNYSDWEPDPVIKNDPTARLVIYRRRPGATGQPVTRLVAVSAPAWIEGTRYRTTVSGISTLGDFINGNLSAPPFSATISTVVGNDAYFDLDGQTETLFAAGPAKLHQNPGDLSLWVEVADFSPIGLPDVLSFSDSVPGPFGVADVLSYHARLEYLGTIGPASNTVQVLRVPPVPVVPPPFAVQTLGVDFYNRTMLQIRFTNAVSEGRYTVWFATGAVPPSEFEKRAVPGEQRAQAPYKQRFLFDVLSLPLPQAASRTITIGVQRVNEGGGQSSLKTVQYALPPLEP